MHEILAQVEQSDIAQALKSKDVLVGAEWEFILEPSNITKPRGIEPKALKLLEKAAETSTININPWIEKMHHTTSIKDWKLETDLSLPKKTGAELISPPMLLKDFLKICPNILRGIDVVGYTNNKCGLHIGISFKKMLLDNSQFNPLKLALFIDENLVYSIFSKKARTKFGGPVKNLLNVLLKARRENPTTTDIENLANALEKDLQKALISVEKGLQKSYGINVAKLAKYHYIEFRYMGGTNYQAKWEQIKQIIGMYIFVLKISCDSNYKKEEYERKVQELLKEEIKDQTVLIKDTEEHLKKILPLLKIFNLKLKEVKRSLEFIYLYFDSLDHEVMNKIGNLSSRFKMDYTSRAMRIKVSDIPNIKVLDNLAKLKKHKGNRFIVKKNVVIDNLNKLMWSQDTVGYAPFEEALDKVKVLKLAGYKDWRLPTFKELASLVNYEHINPAIDREIFQDTRPKKYWTSENSPSGSNAVAVDFEDGSPPYILKTSPCFIRAVRNL